MGGMGGPNPKRDLTTLVRKIALLTGDIALKLSPEQAQGVSAALADVEKADELSDDDAKAKNDQILALLDDGQKAQLDAIGLPRPQRGAGGGSPGGPPPAPPANPFQDETNAAALKNLRQKVGGETAPGDAGTPAAPPAEAAPATAPPAEAAPAVAPPTEAAPAAAPPAEAPKS